MKNLRAFWTLTFLGFSRNLKILGFSKNLKILGFLKPILPTLIVFRDPVNANPESRDLKNGPGLQSLVLSAISGIYHRIHNLLRKLPNYIKAGGKQITIDKRYVSTVY
jgi:hypothetical protein